ncbi:Fur family transcriptional regulator [Adhaeribacter aquaticus]|uniref:Fur family transcriptional regulator n=1 Tax=Adhaeribacter aquaticus TaxID=299567 RepID=UPI00047E8EBA|nr:transcriptional repressor [Adhaeribacter aquaticus]
MIKRNTKAKQMILESLKTSKSAISQDNLQAQLGDLVDRATIYRVLNSFYEDGVVHKIVGDDGKQYFAYCRNCSEKSHHHNHFHFRCLNCGKIECLPNEMEVNLPEKYRTINFNGFISGYCSLC